ncbi:MAG: hypothetical protein O2887_06270 [Bacteroidetes bacterium]|nr:hypothetical protein [Bacteroidota bacterium]MDA1120087.1 hypothetical protein [Bacteroidota bacterium]
MNNYHLASTSISALSILSILIDWSGAFLFTTFSGYAIGIIFLINANKFYDNLLSSKRKRGFVLLTILASFFVFSGATVQYFQNGIYYGLGLIVQGVSMFAWLSFFHYRRATRLEGDRRQGINYRMYSIISISYVLILGIVSLLFLLPVRIVNKIEIIREVPLTILFMQGGLLAAILWSDNKSGTRPIWALLLGGLLVNSFYLLL